MHTYTHTLLLPWSSGPLQPAQMVSVTANEWTENKFKGSDVIAMSALYGFTLQNPFPSFHDERWPPAIIWFSADAGNNNNGSGPDG